MCGGQRLLQGVHFVAVSAFEFGHLGGEGAQHAAWLVGVGSLGRGRQAVLLLGAQLFDAAT